MEEDEYEGLSQVLFKTQETADLFNQWLDDIGLEYFDLWMEANNE